MARRGVLSNARIRKGKRMKIEVAFVSEKEDERLEQQLARDENGILWDLYGIGYHRGGSGRASLQYTKSIVADVARHTDLSGTIYILRHKDCEHYIHTLMQKLGHI